MATGDEQRRVGLISCSCDPRLQLRRLSVSTAATVIVRLSVENLIPVLLEHLGLGASVDGIE